MSAKAGRYDVLCLLGLAAAAFLVHGFHPYSEDAETYLPGIEKVLHPQLFPIGSEYFQLHAHLTWFPQLIAGSVRLFHLPLPWVLFLWQFVSFFLFLLACWELARRVFPGQRRACWAGVSLVAALFTMPVAGTALYLMDPFLNPRNITAFAEVFATLRVIERRYFQAAVFLAFGVSIHPFMTAFSATFCLLVFVMDRWLGWKAAFQRARGRQVEAEQADPVAPAVLVLAPVDGIFSAPSSAYDRVAASHRYQFLSRWTWYEMLGGVAPIFIFWGFSVIAQRRGLRNLKLLSRAMMIYGAIYFVAGLAVSIPHRLEVFSLLQPMRSLRLLYVLMLLLGGTLLGDYVLKSKVWRWVAVFLPLSVGMCWAQRALYPASSHIEWPGAQPRNPWVQAFEWTRDHTPEDAIFAIDPHYMSTYGEDANGFRAVAQRSRLADAVKDSGVVELFPGIGDSWNAQVTAQTGIDSFRGRDFTTLRDDYKVTWAVLRQRPHSDLDCPYVNTAVMVCRLP